MITDSKIPWLNKVPEVTLFFWLIKMMSTTVGETAADFLNMDLDWGLTSTTGTDWRIICDCTGSPVKVYTLCPGDILDNGAADQRLRHTGATA